MGNCCKTKTSDVLKRKKSFDIPLFEQLEWQNLMLRNDLMLDCENMYNARELLKGDRGRLEDREQALAVHQDMLQQVKIEEEAFMLHRRGELEIAQICLRKDRKVYI